MKRSCAKDELRTQSVKAVGDIKMYRQKQATNKGDSTSQIQHYEILTPLTLCLRQDIKLVCSYRKAGQHQL